MQAVEETPERACPQPPGLPLDGLKIVELGHYIAAPFATRLLADLGAEVIKVEPPEGDPVRGWGSQVEGHAVWFSVHGRNKLSVTLDLKNPDDKAKLRQLVGRADALVENFRPGQLERYGLGPAALHAVNPRLVIARISGYGQDGPYRDKPAFGAIGEAMGGLRHLTANPGQTELPPPRCGVSISDDLAGMYAAMGLVSACWGIKGNPEAKGRVIDVDLVGSVFSLMEGMLPEYGLFGWVRQPQGAAIKTAAPTNTYLCADGKWLCIAGNSDLIFRRLMAAIGRPELAAEPRFANNAARCENVAELDAAITAWTVTQTGGRGRGGAGGRRGALLPPVRHEGLRRGPAFPGPRPGDGGRRPAARQGAAPRRALPLRRRPAARHGALDGPRRRGAQRRMSSPNC